MKIIEPVSVIFDDNITSADVPDMIIARLDSRSIDGLVRVVEAGGLKLDIKRCKKGAVILYDSGSPEIVRVPLLTDFGRDSGAKIQAYELVGNGGHVHLKQVSEEGDSDGRLGGSYHYRGGIEGEICLDFDSSEGEKALRIARNLRENIEKFYNPRQFLLWRSRRG